LKKRTEQNNNFKFTEKRKGERKKDHRKPETEEKQKTILGQQMRSGLH
jgi:hypothetical protein